MLARDLKGDADRVVVRDGAHGKGIHARREFQPGDQILEFTGPILNRSEVIAMGEAQAYTIQIGPDRYIDTEPLGRFTNHSCAPNAGVAADQLLMALRPIKPGEEIRFDYSTTMSENYWTLACGCGEPECRGVIRDFHLLPPSLQEYYVRNRIVQAFIVREWKERQLGLAEAHPPVGAAAGSWREHPLQRPHRSETLP
jgi:hypothetical protein